MDETTSNLCSAESQNYQEPNRKSECTDDENGNPTEPNELNNNTNELFDIDSSDLDYDSSDMDRDENKNQLLQTIDSEKTVVSAEKNVDGLSSNNDNNNELSENSIGNNEIVPNESHSTDKQSDIQTEPIENTNDLSKPADNCLQDKETHTTNDEHAYDEGEEPIFDFLGKANEIVCYLSL